ncbi:MAG: sulfite exporter TauE/SafE family protein [Oligoflexia bacterium]|nr:sulfite exporter TauE/SafE family protein [Oligoflexia bacterium]
MNTLAVLMASLLGSAHCVGMCGGFVTLYSAERSGWRAHLGYSFGRLTTYLCLGVIAGWIGGNLDSVGLIWGVQRISALVMGVLMIYWGIKALIPSVFGAKNGSAGSFQTPYIGKLLTTLIKSDRLPAWSKPFAIGLFTTLLPCGWLYTFVALAAASGAVATGAGIMATFWVGTLPAMLSLGVFARALLSRLGAYVPRVTAVLLLSAGFFSLLTHLQPHHTTHGHQEMHCHH